MTNNYKQKYNDLVSMILENGEKIPTSVVTQAKIIHTRQEEAPQEEKKQDDKVKREEFENMSYFQKVELKEKNPEAYDNALSGNFKGES